MKNFEESTSSKDIAVIGISCKFPGSVDINSFWNNLTNGKESIRHLDKEELSSLGVKRSLLSAPNYISSCGFLENIDKFDNEFFKINPLEAEAMDPQQRLFIEEAYHALEDAGYTPDKYHGKIGIYAGSGPTEYYYELIRTGYFEKHPQSKRLLYYLGNEKDFLALRAAYALNLTGPAININLASATGLAVVVKACQSLVNHEADIMLSGAVSVILPNQFGYIYEPENIFSIDGHCRPFDAKSTGTVLGSGIGIIVLKRLTDAIKDNDSIHAVIKGYALNNDGYDKIGFTAPSIKGQYLCFEDALTMANVDPAKLQYIEAHGTGTALGDPIEIAALTKGLNKRHNKKQYCAIGSVKSNIGHCQSAAGMAGLIKMILAVKNKTIPASLHFNTPNPKINFSQTPFYVNSNSVEWNDTVRIGGVNALAMGGVNTHLIVSNYTDLPIFENLKIGYNLFPVSANNETSLQNLINKLIDYLNALSVNQLSDINLFHSIAYTLQIGRKDLSCKKIWLCQNITDLLQQLNQKEMLNKNINNEVMNFQNIANNWLSGRKINWDELYTTKPQRIPLPTYPFKQTRHWIITEDDQVTPLQKTNESIKEEVSNIDIQFILDKISDIWKKALKIENLSFNDSFDKLGGDSLLAIAVLSEIEKHFCVRISIEDFFKHDQPILLANYIIQQNENIVSKEKLVPLTGMNEDKKTIIIIHPGNGELYFYKPLAELLSQNFNLIGIHNNVFNDYLEDEPLSVSKLAERYIDLLRTNSCTEPYILCGWSFGGAVAFEMANQLSKQNKCVEHIFLIDSWAKHTGAITNSDYFYNVYLKKAANNNNLGVWEKLLWNRMQALFNYRPAMIDTPVTLFKASTINDEYTDANIFDNHWQQYCKKRLNVFQIQGDHETLLQPPGLEKLVNLIDITITTAIEEIL